VIFLKIVLIVTVVGSSGNPRGHFLLSMPDMHSCALEMESYMNHAYEGYQEGDDVIAACKGTVPRHSPL
jgi:hypothetical protein